MTQEQKTLLIRDLCARLPYGVKCTYYDKCVDEQNEGTITGIQNGTYFVIDGVCIDVENVRPYLFPLSSMSEEQYDEMEKVVLNDYTDHMRITNELREKVDFITHWPLYSPDVIDWFNRNHFDYKGPRGLIEIGLAIDATGKNIYQNMGLKR